MTPERKNRIARQVSIGRDAGMRLKLQWADGYSVTVHSWDAASVLTGLSVHTLRIYWAQGKLTDDFECRNPSNDRVEPCVFIEEQKARRGPPRDPQVQATKRRALQAKIARAEEHVAQLKLQLEQLS